MLTKELISPRSIVVVGASNNISKPGGKLLKNLVDFHFSGELMAVNRHEDQVQGVPSYKKIDDLPAVDLAVLAIPAAFCEEAVELLACRKGTKGFIIISAGFGELGPEGRKTEERIAAIATRYRASLIGPNCIGLITPVHASVFTTPVPRPDPLGCDLISSSGATAVFIMESGITKGLRFASVFSVGNAAQTRVEDILEHMDQEFDPHTSPRVKLLYVESIADPDKFLIHSRSLVRKGCRIAGIKAGTGDAGKRAASSHTGAMANPDLAVEALFRKAGIVRCYGREELTTVGNIFMCKEMKGNRLAIITHAGGPAVMLTDALEAGGLHIPQIVDSLQKKRLKDILAPGSSVENPIDFLATGTAAQLAAIIDACDQDFDEIDGMAVIYGSPGLFPVRDVYEMLNEKMHSCRKPIYPILPSVLNVKDDVAHFISSGNVNFPDEVVLGRALSHVYRMPRPHEEHIFMEGIDMPEIRRIIERADDGYQPPAVIHRLFDAAGIPRVKEMVVNHQDDAMKAVAEVGFPLVMKVIGPVHKTEVEGVVLNVRSRETVLQEFERLRAIPGANGVLMAEMASGIELFIGAKYEDRFGHVMLCGMGGILVEVLKDVTSGLAPLTISEASSMIKNLKAYKIIKGYRGQEGVNERAFADIIVRLSSLLRFATEIREIDMNPLLGKGDRILTVDASILIKKKRQ